MADGSQRELVERARRGDGAAVEALVRQHLRPAYAVALAVLRNVADAEDVAQDALVGALERLEECRDPARFTGWLLTGVRHRALNLAEQARARAAVLALHPPRPGAEPGAAETVATRQRLLQALEALSPVQREVVLLHDLEGWTHAEIAGALELSEVNSRQHLFTARQKLRALLEHEAPEAGHGS